MLATITVYKPITYTVTDPAADMDLLLRPFIEPIDYPRCNFAYGTAEYWDWQRDYWDNSCKYWYFRTATAENAMKMRLADEAYQRAVRQYYSVFDR